MLEISLNCVWIEFVACYPLKEGNGSVWFSSSWVDWKKDIDINVNKFDFFCKCVFLTLLLLNYDWKQLL